jgi:hypothetical protein
MGIRGVDPALETVVVDGRNPIPIASRGESQYFGSDALGGCDGSRLGGRKPPEKLELQFRVRAGKQEDNTSAFCVGNSTNYFQFRGPAHADICPGTSEIQ